VLLYKATQLAGADKKFHAVLHHDTIQFIVSMIPDAWLLHDAPFPSAEEHRQAYAHFITLRLAHSKIFVQEANDARTALI
jgi:hypothetical protein